MKDKPVVHHYTLNMVFQMTLPNSFDSGKGFRTTGSEKILSQGSELRLYDLEDEATQLEMILPSMATFLTTHYPWAKRTRVI